MLEELKGLVMQLFIPMRGCEVGGIPSRPDRIVGLFIPMRGCESRWAVSRGQSTKVIYPHEGL